MIDSDSRRPSIQFQVVPEPRIEDQRGHPTQWDSNLHRGLNRLDINTPPRDTAGTWASDATQALHARAEQARVRFEPEVEAMPPSRGPMPPSSSTGMMGPRHQHTVSAPAFNTPREARRHGWYNGPASGRPAGETILEGRPHVDRIVHPNVSSFQGFPARDQQQPIVHQQQPQPGPHGERVERMERIPERPSNQGGEPEAMKRLEALVAVATGQGSVAAAY